MPWGSVGPPWESFFPVPQELQVAALRREVGSCWTCCVWVCGVGRLVLGPAGSHAIPASGPCEGLFSSFRLLILVLVFVLLHVWECVRFCVSRTSRLLARLAPGVVVEYVFVFAFTCIRLCWWVARLASLASLRSFGARRCVGFVPGFCRRGCFRVRVGVGASWAWLGLASLARPRSLFLSLCLCACSRGRGPPRRPRFA